jgi:glycosyltransferase involved in cell wall biosynthesis
VLHVIPSVSLVRGGPSQAILELATASRGGGLELEIIATNDDGPGVLKVPLGEPVEFHGARVRFFPSWSPPVRPLREFAYSASLSRWLRQHVREFDLVHVHALFSYASSIGMRIARQAGVPYIVRPSGLLCRWSLQQSRLRKRLFLALLDRANLNGSAAIEFTSEQEQHEAADLKLTAPGFVMPYGLNLPVIIPGARDKLRERLHLPPDEPILLFLSRLHPKKGVQHLIPAAAALAGRRFTLVIAGSGDPAFEGELRHLASSAPPGRIRFVGFAAGEFKQELLQGADVFVLPSYSESFAIAVMEALAVGVPVVTTPGVPLSQLVQKFDLGWVCPPESASLAKVLFTALDAVGDAAAMQERAGRSRSLVAQNLTWPIIAGRMTSVYQAVLHRRALPSFELGQMTP